MNYFDSNRTNTVILKYDSCFSKFKSWCRQFNLEYLPAKASTVTIYLTSLIQSGCSVSVLNSNFYAVIHEYNAYPYLNNNKVWPA
jgi:hypothetical protein